MRPFALVTGTSRGIGASTARSLLERGVEVLGISRSDGTIDHPDYRHVRLDLSWTADVERFFGHRFLKEIAPRICADEIILVNNGASIGRITHLETQSLDEMVRAHALNATVPIWLMGFIAGRFNRQVVKIVNISSGAAQRPYAGWTSYCAGKSALLMASRVYAEEQQILRAGTALPPRPVICFAPGSVDTQIQGTIRQACARDFPELEKFHRLKEARRLFSPADVGEAVARIALADHPQVFRNLRYLGADRLLCLESGAEVPIDGLDRIGPAERPASQVSRTA